MIGADKEAQIVRLYHAEKWPCGTIATQLGVHPSVVRRVLGQQGLVLASRATRPSKVEPYLAFIRETLAKYPRLRASRLYRMVRERGYTGGPDHFRSVVARYRPRPVAEAYARLRTLPGEQAQVDWGHFGHLQVPGGKRPLYAFVMVLSYSRQLYLRFSLSCAMPSFLRGHVESFSFFGGVPRRILYDNLKSAVLERAGDAIRFHPTLLELSAHYRFEARPCAPARGNEKGRVERAIRYVRDAFFAARTIRDLDELNAQALSFCRTEAAERPCPEDRTRTVAQVFADEQGRLLPLPDTPLETGERVEVHVGKTPYVRFDLNDYSVPPTHVRRTLTVYADEEHVRILDGASVLCTHARRWGRGQQNENPEHLQALVAYKQRAKEGQGIETLHRAVPASRALLLQIAERGGNVGASVYGLVKLLHTHGADTLSAAVQEALSREAPHLGAVRQSLDRILRTQGKPPPVPIALPEHVSRRDRLIVPHRLDDYEQLGRPSPGENP